jgi:DNA topoisomerase III
MIVCIAEKPSVGKDLARVLGAVNRKDGFYEGNGYRVTWTYGHLCTLKEPHEYNAQWKYWSLHTLPILPARFGVRVIENEGIKKQFSVIERLVKDAKLVINCGDAGQEGELIQRWVLQQAGCTCPVQRLWISSMTDEAIREGFQNLKTQDKFENLYMAGMSRAVGDWLLGINSTRLYTVKYGQRGQLLSIGRVQTPTLALIVERQKEIDNFKPEPFWEMRTKYRDVWFSHVGGRFATKESGQNILAAIMNRPFAIKEFEAKDGTDFAPRLFDLTSLQVECNRKLGFSAEKTLQTIQSLYEKKLTSYPRVDTTYLSDDIYPKIPGILKGLKAYEQLTLPLLSGKLRKTKRVFDSKKVTDHHAIIPTGIQPVNLSPDENSVFEMVTLRFIAAFYPDCKVLLTTVLGAVDSEEFKASGKQIIEPGWRAVLQHADDESDKEKEEQVMPVFAVGETGEHEPELTEKETKPPRYYTEASLLRAMETAGKQVDDDELRDALKENGIGRPSTRSGIIETLFKRNYMVRDKKRIVATPTGIELINTIKSDLLKSAGLTGIWEKKLREIEAGRYDVKAFIAELKEMVTSVVNEVKQDNSSVVIPLHVTGEKPVAAPPAQKSVPCPKCKTGVAVKGKAAYGCTRWNEGCDFRVPFILSGRKLTETQINTLITKGKTPLIKGMQFGENKVDGWFVLNAQSVPEFEPAEAKPTQCPACKNGSIIKGRQAFGCTNYKNGCRFLVPFVINGKTINETIVNQLITNGKTRKLTGFEVNGLPVTGYLELDANFALHFKEVI